MAFKPYFETDEQEAARLATGSPWSKNCALSNMPVTLRERPVGLLVKLPSPAWHARDVIVFVREDRTAGRHVTDEGLREYDGSYLCTVVASNHESCPVGGYDIDISESELRRGTKIALDPATGQLITD